MRDIKRNWNFYLLLYPRYTATPQRGCLSSCLIASLSTVQVALMPSVSENCPEMMIWCLWGILTSNLKSAVMFWLLVWCRNTKQKRRRTDKHNYLVVQCCCQALVTGINHSGNHAVTVSHLFNRDEWKSEIIGSLAVRGHGSGSSLSGKRQRSTQTASTSCCIPLLCTPRCCNHVPQLGSSQHTYFAITNTGIQIFYSGSSLFNYRPKSKFEFSLRS